MVRVSSVVVWSSRDCSGGAQDSDILGVFRRLRGSVESLGANTTAARSDPDEELIAG